MSMGRRSERERHPSRRYTMGHDIVLILPKHRPASQPSSLLAWTVARPLHHVISSHLISSHTRPLKQPTPTHSFPTNPPGPKEPYPPLYDAHQSRKQPSRPRARPRRPPPPPLRRYLAIPAPAAPHVAIPLHRSRERRTPTESESGLLNRRCLPRTDEGMKRMGQRPSASKRRRRRRRWRWQKTRHRQLRAAVREEQGGGGAQWRCAAALVYQDSQWSPSR
jgi:hypothetical protein